MSGDFAGQILIVSVIPLERTQGQLGHVRSGPGQIEVLSRLLKERPHRRKIRAKRSLFLARKRQPEPSPPRISETLLGAYKSGSVDHR
jgi:hypothetical protein